MQGNLRASAHPVICSVGANLPLMRRSGSNKATFVAEHQQPQQPQQRFPRFARLCFAQLGKIPSKLANVAKFSSSNHTSCESTEKPRGMLAFAQIVVAKATDTVVTMRDVRLKRIRGDGRCLFRAIARNIAAQEGRELSENFEREDADFLRMSAHKVICVDRKEEFRTNMLIEGSVDSYCSAMRSPSFYGGELEMHILSELLQKPIAVFLAESMGRFRRIVEYGDQFRKGGEKPIRVLYNGVNHYDALLPLK